MLLFVHCMLLLLMDVMMYVGSLLAVWFLVPFLV